MGRALTRPLDVAVSPDSRNVYSNDYFGDGIAVFRRSRRRGALAQLRGPRGCVTRKGRHGCARGRGLSGVQHLTISPNGQNLYGTTDDGVVAFHRGR